MVTKKHRDSVHYIKLYTASAQSAATARHLQQPATLQQKKNVGSKWRPSLSVSYLSNINRARRSTCKTEVKILHILKKSFLDKISYIITLSAFRLWLYVCVCVIILVFQNNLASADRKGKHTHSNIGEHIDLATVVYTPSVDYCYIHIYIYMHTYMCLVYDIRVQSSVIYYLLRKMLWMLVVSDTVLFSRCFSVCWLIKNLFQCVWCAVIVVYALLHGVRHRSSCCCSTHIHRYIIDNDSTVVCWTIYLCIHTHINIHIQTNSRALTLIISYFDPDSANSTLWVWEDYQDDKMQAIKCVVVGDG